MQWVRKFIDDIQGGFAIWFAVGAMTLAVAGGAAIDVNHAHRAERYLQDLTDNAALAAARDHTLKTKEKKKIAKAFIKEAFDHNYDLHILKVKLKERKDGTVQVVTVAEINTMMMGMLGKKTLKVKALSEVSIVASGGPVEISFVLDATASMATFGSDWNNVVNALEDLMVDLEADAGDPSNFKASLVPFGDRVNLGTQAYSWIDNSYLTNPAAAAAYQGCTEPREEVIGGNPNRLTRKPPNKLPFVPSTIGTYAYVTGCPNVPIIYPTTNIGKLKTEVRNISPAGTGRYDIGLAWGHRMLSNNWRKHIGGGTWPKKKNVTKVAVFMTDGYSFAYEGEVLPNVDPQPWGWNLGTPEGFDNLQFICNRMKEDGIQIHVIGVNVQPHAITPLQTCATDMDHYYSVSDASDVVDAIGEIGTKTTELRLTH